MFVFSITNAYSGNWSSDRHEIEINFNENTWSIVESIDTLEDTLYLSI